MIETAVQLGVNLANLKSGSARINEMKKDIDFAVNAVLGFLKPEDCIGHGPDHPYTFVRFERGELDWHGFMISGEFELYIWENSDCVYSSSNGGASAIPLAYVQEVHDGLDQFLQSVTDDFPVLVSRLQPLLVAGKAT